MVAMGLSAKSQIILGENHAMLRLEQGSKYLLLPVQEKEEYAAIAILDSRNELMKRLNVRLAVDNTDRSSCCASSSTAAPSRPSMPRARWP